jgi:hypothetical protein
VQGVGGGAGGHNVVGSVQQSAAVNQTAYMNRATVQQDGYENVGSITQSYIGGSQNSVAIVETGSSAPNVNNYVNAVTQYGGGNIANLTLNNPGTANDPNGAGSFDTYSASGAAAGLLSSFMALDVAPVVYAIAPSLSGLGAPTSWTNNQGTVTQTGENNKVYLNATASGAKFAFLQSSIGTGGNLVNGHIYGHDNDVATAQPYTENGQIYFSISGDRNDVGVEQFGIGSNYANAVTGGSDNHIGILQIMGTSGTNNATSTLDGDRNIAVQLQLSTGGTNNSTIKANTGANQNIVAAVQYASSGSNTANITVGGSSNMAVVAQNSWGGVNNASVSISGSNNNQFTGTVRTFSKADSQAVATAEGTIGHLLPSGLSSAISAVPLGSIVLNANVLTPGLMTQVGSNSLSMTVSSDSNLFSTYQNGSGNSITSLIEGGAGNELAVAQIGDGNHASTTQNGAGNSIGLIQNGVSNASTINQ